VYAGVAPPPSANGTSSGTSPVLYVGVGVIALALIVLVVGSIRAWRNRGLDDDYEDDEEAGDEDDLDARVAAFKRQAQDRATKS
jgi:hypothetical protein